MRLRATCKECGEILVAQNGEVLLQRRRKHVKSCHDGFDVEQIPTPN